MGPNKGIFTFFYYILQFQKSVKSIFRIFKEKERTTSWQWPSNLLLFHEKYSKTIQLKQFFCWNHWRALSRITSVKGRNFGYRNAYHWTQLVHMKCIIWTTFFFFGSINHSILYFTRALIFFLIKVLSILSKIIS